MSTLVRGERPGLTRWEQWLRGAAALLALTSAGFAVWYLVKGFVSQSEYPYVVNSIAKDALLTGLALLVVWDVRRWSAVAVPLIVIAHALMPAALVATALWGKAKGIDHTWIGPPESDPFRLVWGAADRFQEIGYGYRLAYELGAPIERVEGAKHFVPEDHPEQVAAAVNGLLERAAPDQ